MKRILDTDAITEIERIALERAALSSDVELATKYRVSRRRVQQIMKRVRDAVFASNVRDVTVNLP